MVDAREIDRIVEKAVSAVLKGAIVSRVETEPTTDSDGRAALHVTIVFKKLKKLPVSGESALDTIVRIGRDLRDSGDDRFPIVDFVTEDELESDGCSEP